MFTSFTSGKRALSAALVGGLTITALACSSAGGRQAEVTQPPAAATQAAAPHPAAGQATTPRLKISLITHQAPGDTFWDIVRKGAEAAAAKDNVELVYTQDPEGGKQANLVQNAIDSKVAAIAATLAKPDAMADAVKRAEAAGIPVVALNSGFDRWQELGAMMYFGQDEFLAGQAGGQQLSQEGAKHVLCIAPEQGNVSVEARCAGAKQGFSGTLENLYVDGKNVPLMNSTIAAKLKQDPSIDYVLAQGAPATLTTVKSVADDNSSAKIVAFDLNPELVQEIQSGHIEWTIDQQPYVQGYLAIDALWLYLTNGNTVGGGKPVLTGPSFVTKENIAQIAGYAARGTR